MNPLFNNSPFISASGLELDWKIDCDCLTDEALDCIAEVVSEEITFNEVVGVPTGGLRLAAAFKSYAYDSGAIREIPIILLVDDVVTTGKSMENTLALLRQTKPRSIVIGFAIFGRGDWPEWIQVMWVLNKTFRR